MNNMNLSANGKWILAGEHTVTRGGLAVSFPDESFSMTLKSQKYEGQLLINSQQEYVDKFEKIFIEAKRLLQVPYSLDSSFSIESDIPVSCGFGSSAAVCVLLARWFVERGLCDDPLSLALSLEKTFHKNSSGIDIYSVFYKRPLAFSKKNGIKFLECAWFPNFKIHLVKSELTTFQCIEKVEKIFIENPQLGKEIDDKMQSATEKCLVALRDENIQLLAEGINIAANCFKEWGLITEHAIQKIDELKQNGAIAVKPIGSGGGGGILALYPNL